MKKAVLILLFLGCTNSVRSTDVTPGEIVHKGALGLGSVAALSAIISSPKGARLPVAILSAYMLFLFNQIRLREFDSEVYFQNGVGAKIERYINEFLPRLGEPAKSGDEIKYWMEDSYSHERLYWDISEELNNYELQEMKDKLDADIATLGSCYVPCVSLWQDFRRFINGGSPNYTIKQIDDFAKPEIEGANWSFSNLLNLRYGSSGYKIKMMKMIILRKVLEILVTD